MKFDDIIPILGESGRYQLRLIHIACVVGFFCAVQVLLPVFILAIPNLRCAVPGLENDTFAIQDEGHELKVNWSIPWMRKQGSDSEWERDSCHLYNATVPTRTRNSHSLDASYPALTDDVDHGNVSLLECGRYVYDVTTYQSTVMSEWNLVCGQEHMRSHANMLLMGGMLAGALGLGMLADVIGRKKTLLLSVFIHIGSAVGTALAPNYAALVVFRFGAGVASSGLFLSAFVLSMELVGPSRRAMAGMVIHFHWCLGLFVLAGTAYGLRLWRQLSLAVALPSVLLFSLYWLVPESPRWLLSRNRKEEAMAILQRAAKVNGVSLPEKLLEHTEVEKEKQGKVWEMFTHPTLCLRTLIIFFNWFVVSMVYYGLGLNVGNLAGNVYLNFTIASAVETLAYVFCILLLDRAGRKSLHCISMIVSGLACLATIFPVLYGHGSLQWLVVLASMVGKMGASAGFALIYMLSAEIFPTVVRNSGIGASSTCARIGSMISPYIADLGQIIKTQFGPALPLIVFGAFAVMAGLLTCLLPETLHRKLPETIEEAKHFGKGGGDKLETEMDVLPDDPKETNGELNKGYDPSEE